MNVELPSGSSFAVYDENGVCVNFSVVSNNNKVKLPENGTVVFAGAPNSEFTVALNQLQLGIDFNKTVSLGKDILFVS